MIPNRHIFTDIILLAVICAISQRGLCDIIHLTNGKMINGEIVERSDKSIRIRTESVTLTVPRDMIGLILVEDNIVEKSDKNTFEKLKDKKEKSPFEKRIERSQTEDQESWESLVKAYYLIDHVSYGKAEDILREELIQRPNKANMILPWLAEKHHDEELAKLIKDLIWKMPPYVVGQYYMRLTNSLESQYFKSLSQGASSQEIDGARKAFASFLNQESGRPYPVTFLSKLGGNPKSPVQDAYVILMSLQSRHSEALKREDVRTLNYLEQEKDRLSQEYEMQFENMLKNNPQTCWNALFPYLRERRVANFRIAIAMRDASRGRASLISLYPYGIKEPVTMPIYQDRLSWDMSSRLNGIYGIISEAIRVQTQDLNDLDADLEYLLMLLTTFKDRQEVSIKLIDQLWVEIESRIRGDLYSGIRPGSLLKSLEEARSMIERYYAGALQENRLAALKALLEKEEAALLSYNRLRFQLTRAISVDELDPVEKAYQEFEEQWKETIAFESALDFYDTLGQRRANMIAAKEEEIKALQQFAEAVSNKSRIENLAKSHVRSYLERKKRGFKGNEYWVDGEDGWKDGISINEYEVVNLADIGDERVIVSQQGMSCTIIVGVRLTAKGSWSLFNEEYCILCEYNHQKDRILILGSIRATE
jgi:hypothetical protein